MGRKKNPFWEHVQQLENKRFLCKYCGHDFAGSISITRIKYHLSGIRNRDTEICPEVPEDVQEKAFQAMEGSNKRDKSMACSNNGNAKENEIIPTSLTFSSSRDLQQAITSKVRKMDKSEVDEKLAKFLVLCNIDINIMQRPFFIDFLKSIAEFGPSYTLPKSTTLISKIEEEVDKYTENIRRSLFSAGYTVMFGIQHEQSMYVNIFVYTLEGAMLLGSFELSKEEMTYLAFVKNVCSIVNSYGHLSAVQFIISNDLFTHVEWSWDDCSDGDDSESSKSIEDLLIEKYPMAYMTRCVAEEIQSLLKTIYEEVPWVWKTIHLAYVIVKYLNKHCTDLSLGKEQPSSKDYGNFYFNQIASKFLTLTSILKVEGELQALQLPRSSPSCEQKDQALTKEVVKVVEEAIHSKDFWTRAKRSCNFWSHYFEFFD